MDSPLHGAVGGFLSHNTEQTGLQHGINRQDSTTDCTSVLCNKTRTHDTEPVHTVKRSRVHDIQPQLVLYIPYTSRRSLALHPRVTATTAGVLARSHGTN